MGAIAVGLIIALLAAAPSDLLWAIQVYDLGSKIAARMGAIAIWLALRQTAATPYLFAA